MIADGIAELAVRWPAVPIVFAETRQLAEEWTYRYLAAAHAWVLDDLAVSADVNLALTPSCPPAGKWTRPRRRFVPGLEAQASPCPTRAGSGPKSGKHGVKLTRSSGSTSPAR